MKKRLHRLDALLHINVVLLIYTNLFNLEVLEFQRLLPGDQTKPGRDSISDCSYHRNGVERRAGHIKIEGTHKELPPCMRGQLRKSGY